MMKIKDNPAGAGHGREWRSISAPSKYDAFEHLCRSLFKRPRDLMAMLTVYCDDSGNSRVAAVAGYLGTALQWKRFCPEWKRALDKENIQVMHRTNLETWHGEFTEDKGWNPTRRTAFVKRLHPIIKHRTYTGVGTSVLLADFETTMPDWVKTLFGGPYGWCAHECIVAMRVWSDRHRQSDPIEWVFEQGTRGTHEIGLMFEGLCENPAWRQQYRLKPNGWSFKPKSLRPLQSADRVAYELYKHTENRILDKGKRNIRLSALDLFRPHELPYFKYWNTARMSKWLSGWDEKTKASAAMRPKDF